MASSSLLRFVLVLLFLAAVPLAAAATPIPLSNYPQLPASYRSIKLFDQHGRFAGRILSEKRYWTPLERIPVFLQRAVVAVEDARFYEHGGVDLRGIARAAVRNVVKGRLAEGGSTITQQLIKNKYLSPEKTIDRKINEGLMAIEYEKRYSKQQILEMYLNEIYYGNGAWGIAQAARLYFDKNPEELTDAECSFLAGIPQNPRRFNPLAKGEDVSKRRAIVLKRMLDVGMLSEAEYRKGLKQSAAPIPPDKAQWYLSLVRGKLAEQYGESIFDTGGLEVTTAMDLTLQLKGEQLIRDRQTPKTPDMQAALIAIDPANGNLLAVVGGTSYIKGGFNRATQAKRQPGSAIKPLLYAAALEQGITASSLWEDSPVSYPRGDGTFWKPQNYDGKHHGTLTLRQALTSSNNIVAIKLLETVGIGSFSEFASRNGLALRNADLTQALGSEEVTLHDLAMAYQPFAAGGIRTEPRTILRIYDSYRKSWQETARESSQATTPESAFILTDMLKGVLTHGTAKGLHRFAEKYRAAGKTGTTNDYRDAWFIGYTPVLLAAVWVGYDQPRPGGRGFTGGAIAAPIWEQFMRTALANRQPTDFVRPEEIITVQIDPANGLLATPACPDRKEEIFKSGTEPDEYCPEHLEQPAEGSEQLESELSR